MKTMLKGLLFCAAGFLTVPTLAEEVTDSALTCDDFVPTEAALERFPDLVDACQGVVERDGELYAEFAAVVRRATNSGRTTLYLPATDRTFTVQPRDDVRVRVGNRRLRPRDLQRGDEIGIYLSLAEFARPNVEEIAMLSEADVVVVHEVEATPALPTTASQLPATALIGLLMLAAGLVLRRVRTA